MDVGKTRQEKKQKRSDESIWKTAQSTYPRAHSFVYTQLPLLSFENNKSDHQKSQSWAALRVRKERNSIRDIKRGNKWNIIRRVLLGVTVSHVPQNIHHKIHGATSIFLAYTFLEDSFIMNFTAGVVGGFYQFNIMGDAQVRQCASNRSHTHPTASLQNPARAASKGQMMGHKGNMNAARCSVGPITIRVGPSPPTGECHPHSHAYSLSSPCFGRRMAGNPPGFGLFFSFLWQGPSGISCDASGKAWLLCEVVRLHSQGLASLASSFHVVGLLSGVQRASCFLLWFLFKSPFPTVSVLPNIALVVPKWQTLNMD